MEYKNLMFDIQQGVATITFNRPKALNALNRELLGEFRQLLDKISVNEEIRVLVLTGAGEKAFVAGADIGMVAAFGPLEAKWFAMKGQEILNTLESMPIPVIAAVNGFALGGGSEVALACDFIYACEKAMFGLPEINLGLIPGFGGTQRLARLVGKNKAKELLFTGEMISAADAMAIGMVNKVCPQTDLMETVKKTAQAIAKKGRVSLQAAKQSVNTGVDVDLATGCAMEINAFGLCFASDDAKEGTSAFLEKRRAVFNGALSG